MYEPTAAHWPQTQFSGADAGSSTWIDRSSGPPGQIDNVMTGPLVVCVDGASKASALVADVQLLLGHQTTPY